MPSTRKDLTGMTFGRLSVISEAPHITTDYGKNMYRWNCKCSCGNYCIKNSSNLLHGDTKSCGCIKRENVIKNNKLRAKHGDSRSRLYKIWAGMISRCYYEKHIEYNNYGGRGIEVCNEWRNYINFKKWANSTGYIDDKNCTIDRKNNDLGYYPDNCKWSSVMEQSNNRRTNRLVEYNNVEHTIAEWSRETGIRPDTLLYRITHGWETKRALTEPVRK